MNEADAHEFSLLKTELATLAREIKADRERLERNERKLALLNGRLEKLEKTYSGRDVVFAAPREKKIAAHSAASAATRNATAKTADSRPTMALGSGAAKSGVSGFKFVDAYNAIYAEGKSSFEMRRAREDFLRTFKVRAFGCVNYEARMENTALAPVFRDAPSPAEGNFWAMPVQGDKYAVLPNQKLNYEGQIHETGGMKEAFKSNFGGGTYAHIRAVKPAVFSANGGAWTLCARGEILLS